MSIRKLLLAFVIGAMLVGLGAGITVLEVSRWDTQDHPAYLEKQAVQSVEEIAEYDVAEFETINVYATGRPYRFRRTSEYLQHRKLQDRCISGVLYRRKDIQLCRTPYVRRILYKPVQVHARCMASCQKF